MRTRSIIFENSMATIDIRVVTGHEVDPFIPQLARLRITVFREFPYLYDGDEAYERRYLQTYRDAGSSVFVLAMEGDDVVGASTGLSLVEADDEFQMPIADSNDLELGDVFYFGESILLASHRGHGIGHRFFDERERHAASLGFAVTAFCAVERPSAHPLRPPGYRPLHSFWKKRGYVHRPDLVARYAWKDLDEEDETEKPMSFWIRDRRG